MPINNNNKFIIIEKNGTVKEVQVKTITIEELYKKCGFRKEEGFENRNTWENVKVGNHLYTIQLWGKVDGKANTENKYDFPPPVDNLLLFGNCALVQVNKHDHNVFISLTKEQWFKIYETLFGGFEDIDNENDDEEESDELETIKKEMKTKKGGYLKDGFVVDSTSEEELVSDDIEETESTDMSSEIAENDNELKEIVGIQSDEDGLDISVGSELEEEDYEYSDEK